MSPYPEEVSKRDGGDGGMGAVRRELGGLCYLHLKAEMGEAKVEQ